MLPAVPLSTVPEKLTVVVCITFFCSTLYGRVINFQEVLFWPFFVRSFGQHSTARIFYSIARWKALFIHLQKKIWCVTCISFSFSSYFRFSGTYIFTYKVNGR